LDIHSHLNVVDGIPKIEGFLPNQAQPTVTKSMTGGQRHVAVLSLRFEYFPPKISDFYQRIKVQAIGLSSSFSGAFGAFLILNILLLYQVTTS